MRFEVDKGLLPATMFNIYSLSGMAAGGEVACYIWGDGTAEAGMSRLGGFAFGILLYKLTPKWYIPKSWKGVDGFNLLEWIVTGALMGVVLVIIEK